MTRKRVTANEKKQRHEWAIRQIDAGMGLSELTAFTAETWGCSRRQARDVVAKAHKDWLDACYGSEEIDQRDLLFQQVGRLERIARKAENAGQFSAAVGAITALNQMMALGADQKGFELSTQRAPLPALKQLKALGWNAQNDRRLVLTSDLFLEPTLDPFSFPRQ